MKIVRLGNTETGLLFLNFVSNNCQVPENIKPKIKSCFMMLINWLYTTSGYYDKTVTGTKFNFNESAINNNLQEYIKHLEISVQGCHETQFYFDKGYKPLYDAFINKFLEAYNINNFVVLNDTKFSSRIHSIYKYIKNKKVLIVSSFDGIIKNQYNNGNVYKIGLNFPQIASLDTVKFPYCFLNNGPHNNYFETLDHVFNMIKQKDFDIVLLGCGAYGHMLTHKIHNELQKDAIYIGGCITNLFGILSSREKKYTDLSINEYWITDIPEEYKPENYLSVENGCYW